MYIAWLRTSPLLQFTLLDQQSLGVCTRVSTSYLLHKACGTDSCSV